LAVLRVDAPLPEDFPRQGVGANRSRRNSGPWSAPLPTVRGVPTGFPTSGAWNHEQLLEIANPTFQTLDRAQRFLYSVHADLEEVSAYAIDKRNGRITALNRQSCGGKNPVHLRSAPLPPSLLFAAE